MNKLPIRDIIERRIADAGMTKKAFAEKMGRTSGSLNTLITSPSWPTLEKIASVLGISVSELVRDGQKGQDSGERPNVPEITCPRCGAVIRLKVDDDGE